MNNLSKYSAVNPPLPHNAPSNLLSTTNYTLTTTNLLCLLFTLLSPLLHAQPSTERWGLFEIPLHGPTNGNPFLDVQLSADFTSDAPTATANVSGFYDGTGTYRVRFMPTSEGRWHYS